MSTTNIGSGKGDSSRKTGAGVPRIKAGSPIDPSLCYPKQLLCQTMGLKERGWRKLKRDLAKLEFVPVSYQRRVYVMGAWVIKLIMEEGRGDRS